MDGRKKQSLTDEKILRRHHRFLRESEDESEGSEEEHSRSREKNKNIYEEYGEKLAKKYYDKLYKQYAIVDLSRYEKGQVGCRWRTEKQVDESKGEKYCAAVHCRQNSSNIYQMNFGYVEEGVKKNALVKVSVCKDCSLKLNFKKALKKVEGDRGDPAGKNEKEE